MIRSTPIRTRPTLYEPVGGPAGNPLDAQDYGARLGTVQRGGKVSFEPTGPGVLFDALDPTVRRWCVPQELYSEYQWKQWEYSNYARENYQRYVSTSLEGNFFYDLYGNFVTRGWLIYDWQEINPEPFGSTLTKTLSLAVGLTIWSWPPITRAMPLRHYRGQRNSHYANADDLL